MPKPDSSPVTKQTLSGVLVYAPMDAIFYVLHHPPPSIIGLYEMYNLGHVRAGIPISYHAHAEGGTPATAGVLFYTIHMASNGPGPCTGPLGVRARMVS